MSNKIIVPLHSHTLAAATAAPNHLAYGGGPLLTSVQVYTIFWGAAWNQSPQNADVPHVNQFFDSILTSALIDLLAEYSVPGKTIGHGRRIGSITITNSVPGGGTGQVTDSQIQQAINGWIQNGTIPQPNANTLYFVYLPPNITAFDPQGDQSCQKMCGYHWYISGTSPEVYYAVLPYPCLTGCVGPLSQHDALTSVSSHELCEAITDPHPWNGWNDNVNGEIGDLCSWNLDSINGYAIQKEWSIPDLVFIKTNNTPNGHVELHIASGASNYQTRIFESATTFANENDGTWLMGNFDGDGIPDLIFIKTNNTPNGHVEVHVASGASHYQTRIFESTTTFLNENDGVWVMADYDKDGRIDLIFIKTSNTPNGHVEVHVARGR